MRHLANVDLATLLAGIQWWQLIVAITVMVVGWILGRLTRRAVLALFARAPGLPRAAAYPTARIAEYLVVALGIGIALAILGANIQPLLAVVIIVAVVAVLVLRGTADNFTAGVLIQSENPVRIGDEIQVDTPGGAVVGTVTELTARAVMLLAADGRTVVVPNAKLLGDSVVNHTLHGLRRSEIQFRLPRVDGEAIDDLLSRVAEAAAAVPGVQAAPAPQTLANTVLQGKVTGVVQFWHEPTRGVVVRSDVVRALATAFADRGVEATVMSVQK
ncbi:mechanosensitive ion channel family protein [Microbacterium rhizosphaerae]|uniref:Mechanosensitive ion channel n=1 Tax=Microbacterium rhizosphaerae TaxID=1678237 RepID=A0ABZ0SPC5_9MICO|nr:mechanosensitive ion channel domain-containing protein [Microbacterium rhizosphaerae]WPR90156.1 mechanosensitive ion channel [Microbacterium rhizosphaerae]